MLKHKNHVHQACFKYNHFWIP